MADAPIRVMPRRPVPGLSVLTLRERQVLRMAACGIQGIVIANNLGLSLHTINDHRKTALNRLGLTFAEAVIEMTREGWFE